MNSTEIKRYIKIQMPKITKVPLDKEKSYQGLGNIKLFQENYEFIFG